MAIIQFECVIGSIEMGNRQCTCTAPKESLGVLKGPQIFVDWVYLFLACEKCGFVGCRPG